MALTEPQSLFRRGTCLAYLARIPRARPRTAASVAVVSMLIAALVAGTPSTVTAATKKKDAKKATVTKAVPTAQRVETRASEKRKYTQLKKAATIAVGSQLKTNTEGKARLNYIDGSYTRISNSTELTVLELATAKKPQTRLKLADGQVWNRVKKAAGGSTRYEVETPTAVAAVQGTAFNVRCVLGVCDFAVVEGTVRVAGKQGAPVLLTPNQQVRVDAAGLIGLVQPFVPTSDPWVVINVDADVVEAVASPDQETSTTTTVPGGGGGGDIAANGVTAPSEAYEGQWQFTAVNVESNVTIPGNYPDRPGETFTVPISFAPTDKAEFMNMVSPELQSTLSQTFPPGEIAFTPSQEGAWIAATPDGTNDCLRQRYLFRIVTDPLAADGRATSVRGEMSVLWAIGVGSSASPSLVAQCDAEAAKIGGTPGAFFGTAKFRLTLTRT
jgi:FecR protein